jgi:hypothetical protein
VGGGRIATASWFERQGKGLPSLDRFVDSVAHVLQQPMLLAGELALVAIENFVAQERPAVRTPVETAQSGLTP